MKKIAAVVVTYNRKEILQQCLKHLQEQSYKCDILIVNNASTDGTSGWLEEYQESFENVKIHTMSVNTGGAGGFHYGMRWAAEEGYELIWIMDDDCLPAVDALEKLMEADQILGGCENYGFLSSAVLWKDGHECIMNRQKIVKKFYHHVELMKYGIVQIQQATFVSLLFPTQIVYEFGLPLAQYFIWGDDIEYTRRVAQRGKKECYLVGQSQVIHAMKENKGSDIAVDDIERLDRYRMAYRNENYTYRRQGVVGMMLYIARCGRGVYRICRYAQNHRVKRMMTLLAGIIQGFFFHPSVCFPSRRTDGDNKQK